MHLLFYIKFILQETVMPLRRKTTGSWFCNYQKQICLAGSVCSKDREDHGSQLWEDSRIT